MGLYVVTTPRPIGRLQNAIRRHFRDHFTKATARVWLISTDLTVSEISDLLGIVDGPDGDALIFRIAIYGGGAGNAVWTWLQKFPGYHGQI